MQIGPQSFSSLSRQGLPKFQVVAKFGMMHLVATNVCIVFRTLVKESAKEIFHGQAESGDHESGGHDDGEGVGHSLQIFGLSTSHSLKKLESS